MEFRYISTEEVRKHSDSYRGSGFDGNRTLRMISDIDILQLFLLTGSVGLTGVGFDVPCTIRVLQGYAVTT